MRRRAQPLPLLVAGFAALVLSGSVWHQVVAASPFDAANSPVETQSSRQRTQSLLVPGGWRLEQVADLLDTYEIVDGAEFLRVVRDRKRARAVTGETGPATLEGELAPGRYELEPGMDPARVVRAMVARQRRFLPPGQALPAGMTRRQVLTLASVVQREAGFESDMPVIAGVFLNRLRRGQLLQSDPTVIYALDSTRGVGGDATLYWQRKLTPKRRYLRELRVRSPYNTYRYPGLPRGPIAAPSRQAIDAVVHAPDVPLRYFLAKRNGASVFAASFAEHKRNIRRHGEGRVPRRSAAGLEGVISRIAEPFEGHVGVFARNMTSGRQAELNANDFFNASGLTRQFLVAAVLAEQRAGRISFDDRLGFLRVPDWRNDGPDAGPTVGSAVRARVVSGAERSAVLLQRRLGAPAIARALRRIGLRRTFLVGDRFITTPRDVARLLDAVTDGRAVSPSASAMMRRLMPRGGQGVAGYLADGLGVRHQRGASVALRHDAGMIDARGGRLLVVGMTEHVSDPDAAQDGIARLGQFVTGYVDDYRELEQRVRPACEPDGLAPLRPGPLDGRRIALDPGHGGSDPGTSFAFGKGADLEEKTLTLDISERLTQLLRERGATVFRTRCADRTLGLEDRAALANRWDADLMLSLHLNGSDRPAVDGTEVFYLSRGSHVLANHLRGSFALPGLWSTLNRGIALSDRGVDTRRFSILVYSRAPTILTEALYMSNPAEAASLRTDRGPGSRHEQIARGHLSGVLNFFAQEG